MQELTARQLEVLQALANGKQLKGAAYDMGVTIKAIENHVTLLKAKLNAQTIGHCVAQGFRQGLLK
jgi:DNA-binding NarL/FixJ family response regulator